VTAINGRMELWWNRTETGNHWLQLRLTGMKSNRPAIGAVVTCRTGTGARVQSRTINSSVGYASSSELMAHFGLGAEKAATIEIRWPSGRVQRVGEVAANQRLAISEPVG